MKPSLKRFKFSAMGSYCEIQINDESRIHAKNIIRQLAAEVARLEKKYSRFRPDSFLSEINMSAGGKLGIKIDKETRSLFDHALNCFEQSNGLFDITAGALNRLWDFRTAIVPTQSQIDTALNNVGFHKLVTRNSRVYLPTGLEIDFGGIVKEYAADSIANLARKLGVEHGLINLGGDFAVIGPQLDNTPWPIGVANPNDADSMMAKVDILDGGLASSGDYQRFFEHEGTRYSHIINPKTGWPSKGLRAVSVAANLCTVAGSMATIAMLKDPQDAKQFLQDGALPHVFMDQQGDIGGVDIRVMDQEQESKKEEPQEIS